MYTHAHTHTYTHTTENHQRPLYTTVVSICKAQTLKTRSKFQMGFILLHCPYLSKIPLSWWNAQADVCTVYDRMWQTEKQKVTFINDTQTARQCIRVKVAFLILYPPVVWSPLSTVLLHYIPDGVTHWLLFWHSVCLRLHLPSSFSSSQQH